MARHSDLPRYSRRLKAQLNDAEPGPYRDNLELKLGQIRVTLNLGSWAYSPRLQTPE
jgi:hypothetical protein